VRFADAPPVAEPDDSRPVVRCTLGGQVRQEWKLVRAFASSESASHHPFLCFQHPVPRAAAPLVLSRGRARPEDELLTDPLSLQPAVALGVNERMQRVRTDRRAPERHASLDQAFAVAGNQIGLAQLVQAGTHGPLDNVPGRTCHDRLLLVRQDLITFLA